MIHRPTVKIISLLTVFSHRVCGQSIRYPSLPGNRKWSCIQAASGCSKRESTGLSGPGSQCSSLPGREMAAQWKPANGQCSFITWCCLNNSNRGPQQTSLISVHGQQLTHTQTGKGNNVCIFLKNYCIQTSSWESSSKVIFPKRWYVHLNY